MATRQVTLRHSVTVNLRQDEVDRYGLKDVPGAPGDPIQGKGARVITLPAGLVNIPEELCEHWFVKAAIEAGKRPLMGGPRINMAAHAAAVEAAQKPQELATTAATLPATDTQAQQTGQTGQSGQDQTVTDTTAVKPAAELESMGDDDLRQYLREVGKQPVSAAAPRDKVLARIEKLRPQEK